MCSVGGWLVNPGFPGLQEMPPFRSRPRTINGPSLGAWGGMFLGVSVCSRVARTAFCEVALWINLTSRAFVR